jgi:type I restriction enzyme, S subunit
MTSWQATPLGDILLRSDEVAEIRPDESYKEITVKLWGKGVVLRRIASGAELNGSRRFLARQRRLILSRIDARNGAIGIVPESLDGSVVSNDFPLFQIDNNRALPQYLEWLSKTKSFVELCQRASEGTTNRVRLQEDRFLNLQIPLPPLPEQRRIVARIEDLAVKINEARGLREKADVEASILLTSFVSRVIHKSRCNTVTVGDLVGEGSLRNGISVKSSGDIGDVRCLTLSAMRNGRIDLHDNKVVPLTVSEAEPFLVRRGDVFIVRGNGSKNLCGMAGLAAEEGDSIIFPDLFIRVPLPEHLITPEFFVAVWNSSATREVIEEKAKTTSGIWKVNQGHISSTEIPVPPLPEQYRIVLELNALTGHVNALKKLQAQTAAEISTLVPSILDKALSGCP